MDPKKLLLKELKKAGLNIGEDAVKGVVEAVFEALPQFFLATENKVDDLAIAILPIIKPHVIAALDKIDGEVDEAKE
tara:strand:+ start:109 stop:339 length:231 start_codon:yes stop_codon:yes gene_type:complete